MVCVVKRAVNWIAGCCREDGQVLLRMLWEAHSLSPFWDPPELCMGSFQAAHKSSLPHRVLPQPLLK